MNFELFLAFRYLRAKRKQTMVSVISAISALGITAGVMALIIALALSTGFREDIQAKILGTTSAINLMRVDGNPIENYDRLTEGILPVAHITGTAPAIFGSNPALLVLNNKNQRAMIKGIDPSRERQISDFFSQIVAGDPQAFERTPWRNEGDAAASDVIMIGHQMAKSLNAVPGSTIKIMYPVEKVTPLGMSLTLKTMRAQVGAIFETGLYDIDANWAYVNMETARHLFSLPEDSALQLQFKTDDIERVRKTAEEISRKAGKAYFTATWIDSNKSLFSALKLEKLVLFLTIGLIVLVAALNIVTSLVMMVMDKQGDISILAAMGATPRLIRKAFMLQGLAIGIAGTVLGDVLGVGISWLLDHYRLIRLEPEIYSIPYVPFHVQALDVLLVSVTAIAISYLATLYPSGRAARLDPVEVLRYE